MCLIYSWRNENVDVRDAESEIIVYHSEQEIVTWSKDSIWEPAIMDTHTFEGKCTADEWLDALGAKLLGRSIPPRREFRTSYSLPMATAVGWAYASNHAFLDSFSIIENGEKRRRVARHVKPSPCQAALLRCVSENNLSVSKMTPREFEVLVAHTLKDAGATRVELRRYSKDSGVDILAAVTTGGVAEELVVVEVKHGHRGVTLSVLDRLNGVRDRMGADRALAVASGHVTSAAIVAYEAHRSYIAAVTFDELLAIASDSPDWRATARGLWSKDIRDPG